MTFNPHIGCELLDILPSAITIKSAEEIDAPSIVSVPCGEGLVVIDEDDVGIRRWKLGRTDGLNGRSEFWMDPRCLDASRPVAISFPHDQC